MRWQSTPGVLLPLEQLGHIHQFFRCFCAVKNLDALILGAIRKRVNDGRAQRNQPNAAGDEHQVLAVILFHREAVAVRPAHRELVAGLELVKRRCATSDLPDGEESLVFGGTGRQGSGELAYAKQRNLGKLAGAEVLEGALLARVLKVPAEGLDLVDLIDHAVEHRDFG